MSEKSEAPAGVIQTRWVELVVGLVIVAIGLLVVYDSHRVGAGWGPHNCRADCGARAWRPCAPQSTCHRI